MKRFISMLLAVFMVVGMLPVSVFAAETGTSEDPIIVYRNPELDYAASELNESTIADCYARSATISEWVSHILSASAVAGGTDVQWEVSGSYYSLSGAQMGFSFGNLFGWAAAKGGVAGTDTETKVQIVDANGTALTDNLTVKVKGYVDLTWNVKDTTYADQVSLNYAINNAENDFNASDVDYNAVVAKAMEYVSETSYLAGWDINGDGVADDTTALLSNTIDVTNAKNVDGITLTAVFGELSADSNGNGVADGNECFTINVETVANGTVTAAIDGKLVNGTYIYDSVANPDGVAVTVTATPNSGCFLVSATESFTAVAGNTYTVTAQFAAKTITAKNGAMTSSEVKTAADLPAAVKNVTLDSTVPAEIAGSIQPLYQARPETPVDITYQGLEINGYILDAQWLSVDAEVPVMDKTIEEVITAAVDEVGTDDLNALLNCFEEKMAFYGCHAFASTYTDGYCTEQIKYVYNDSNATIESNIATLTIEEVRTPTQVNVTTPSITITYGSATTEQILAQLGISVVDSLGNLIENAPVTMNPDASALTVGDNEVTITYAGTTDLATSNCTVTITVSAAPASIVVGSQAVKYGETVVNPFASNCDTIDFIAGMDAHDERYLTGMVKVAIANDLYQAVVAGLQAKGYNYDLNNLTIDQVKDLLNLAAELNAKAAAVTAYMDSIDSLVNTLDEIRGALPVETALTISLVSKNALTLPQNVGLYVVGSVLFDDNYVAADELDMIDAGYLIITPDGVKATLTWNEADSNGVVTLDKLSTFDFGATATAAETIPGVDVQKEVGYFYIGVDSNGDLLINRVNATENVNEILSDTGVYAEVAYIANWDNVMYYAEPLVRPVIVTPNIANVQILDGNGNENHAQIYTYGEEIPVTITVNGVAAPVDGLKVKFVGLDTTVDGWYRSEVPTDAGAYAIVAIYTEKDADGALVSAGATVGTLLIEPADPEFELEDTVICIPDGNEHFADITMDNDYDYASFAIDRTNRIAYVNLPEDTEAQIDALISILPAELETKVRSALSKYSSFDGEVSSETLKAELTEILDKAVAADLTEEGRAMAEKLIAKLTADIKSSEEVTALIEKLDGKAAALNSLIENKINEYLPEKLDEYLREILTISESGVDVNVEKVKADLIAKVESMDKAHQAVAGVLYTMVDEVENALKTNASIQELKTTVSEILTKLETLEALDAETLVMTVKEKLVGLVDDEQLDELFAGILAKVETLGYVEYTEALLTDIAGMFEGDVDVSTLNNTINAECANIKATIKTMVANRDATVAGAKAIEASFDNILTELKNVISTLPEYTFIFGANPSEEGVYDCYAMNISANYKPVFSESTLTIGHVADDVTYENETAATCTEDGIRDEVVYCVNCGAELSRENSVDVPALGHDLVKTEKQGATCTETGNYAYYTCERCGLIFEDAAGNTETTVEAETIPALGHKLTKIAAVKATCTEDGNIEHYSCGRCGKLFEDAEGASEIIDATQITIPATGHTGDNIVIENYVAATCDTAGSYDTVTYCSVCGEEISRVPATIEKLDHIYGPATIENLIPATCDTAGQYDLVKVCVNCNHEDRTTVTIDASEHELLKVRIDLKENATCENDGSYDVVTYCESCNAEISKETKTIQAHGHRENVPVIENKVAPNCTEEGSYDKVVYCYICEAELSRETITIEVAGHIEGAAVIENLVAATCETDGGYDTVIYCDICNAEISREHVTEAALGHAWHVDTRILPSFNVDGRIDYVCLNDASHNYSEVLPRLACPQTRDECPIGPYMDTDPTEWYHDGVHFCIEEGLMHGYNASKFGPSDNVTRCQIVAVLWRMAGQPESNYKVTFKDVPADEWYVPALRWAVEMGIINGYPGNTFKPDNSASREEMAKMFYCYHTGKTTAESSGALANSGLKDLDTISDWAVGFMDWAYTFGDDGLIKGFAGGTLRPTAFIDRAQFATITYRYLTGN